MSKINPNASKLIDSYIESKEPFATKICTVLRETIHNASPSITEDWKWRTPVFHSEEMAVGFASFKKHVSVHFFKGAYMSDKHGLFSDDCSAQHSRTIKFMNISDIHLGQLTDYLKEAFSMGAVVLKKPTNPSKEVVIPELLQNALNSNSLAKKNFENMAFTYRKEYALHISDAKREATKLKRLDKVISNLEKNIKMHEQYKC